ncbi:MAG: ABC transporter permease [Acidobacteriota bacterium]
MSESTRDIWAAVLALVLRLYPSPFRERFGEDMQALYRRRRSRRAAASSIARLGAAVGPLCQTLWGAPSAWLDAGRSACPGQYDRGERPMKNLLHEAHLSLRILFARQRAFTALSVLTLALGLGASTAIFSVVNGVLLAPLPYADPDRIVRLYEQPPSEGFGFFSGFNFVELRERAQSFESLAAISDYRPEGADLTGQSRPQRLHVLRVGSGYFESLGMTPLVGRTFQRSEEMPLNFIVVLVGGGRLEAAQEAAEESGEPVADVQLVAPVMPKVVILSHGFWSQHFGGDRGAVGRFVELDRERFEVVGVMAASSGEGQPDVWLPHNLSPGGRNHAGNHYMNVVGRLAPGVSVEQANAELTRLSEQLKEVEPLRNDHLNMGAVSLEDVLVGPSRSMLWTVFAAVAAMLAVACINVANLFLVRGLGRGQEFGVRSALGAGRPRLFFGVLIESFAISAVGGLLGLGLAAASVSWLLRLRPAALPRFDALSINFPVLLFSLAAVLAAAFGLGLWPAARAARADLRSAFGSRGSASGGLADRRLRELGVALQVALSLVLLTAGALLARNFAQLQGTEMGFDPGQTQTFQLRLPDYAYGEPEQRVEFYRSFFDRLGLQPEVGEAGATSKLPGNGHRNFWAFHIENREQQEGEPWPAAEIRCVAGSSFEVLGIPVLAGRVLGPEDRVGAELAVVVNRALAERYFPEGDAIGSAVFVSGWEPRRIVGIVADARHDPREDAVPKLYVPHSQFADDRNWDLSFAVAPSGPSVDAAALAARVDATLAELDPRLVPFDRRPFADIVAQPIARQRFAAQMMVIFAGVALLLAAVGLFGALAYSLAQRRAEIGVRMALGADRSAIFRVFLGQGLRVLLVGAVLGLAGALAAGQWLKSQLHGIEPYDPIAFCAALAALTLAVAAAVIGPAQRAAKVDPASVLNRE